MTGRAADHGRESYLEFAWAYDQALGKRFFSTLRPLLNSLLERHPVESHTHLDLACGSGLAMEFFARRGFRSVGVDASLPMLTLARARGGRVVASDIRQLALRGTFGLVTCLYDSLNHLLEWEHLVRAFRSARDLLDDRSVFIFDVNHPDIYPHTWGLREPFVSAARDHRLILDTSYSAAERLGVAKVSGWARIGERKVDISEVHRQRAYSEEQIRGALEAAGLGVAELVPFDPFLESGDGRGVKMVFVATAR